jgi:hypothetical protein
MKPVARFVKIQEWNAQHKHYSKQRMNPGAPDHQPAEQNVEDLHFQGWDF